MSSNVTETGEQTAVKQVSITPDNQHVVIPIESLSDNETLYISLENQCLGVYIRDNQIIIYAPLQKITKYETSHCKYGVKISSD